MPKKGGLERSTKVDNEARGEAQQAARAALRKANATVATATRYPGGPGQPRVVKMDGRQALLVPLVGRHGRGRSVTVDPVEWDWISQRYGPLWQGFRSPRDHLVYVGSQTKQAVAAAREDKIDVGDDEVPLVLLARVIARPKPGERVFTWMTGDRYDFRSVAIHAVTDERLAWLLKDASEEQRKTFIAVA